MQLFLDGDHVADLVDHTADFRRILHNDGLIQTAQTQAVEHLCKVFVATDAAALESYLDFRPCSLPSQALSCELFSPLRRRLEVNSDRRPQHGYILSQTGLNALEVRL